MKVAFIAFDSGELSIRTASALSREAEVCLLLPEEEAAPHMQWLDSSIRFRPFAKPRLRQPVKQIRTIGLLLRHIRDCNPDVIHFQKGHLWFNLALPLLERYPLVISIHDPRRHIGDRGAHKTPQAIRNFGFRRADRVIVHNQQMKRQVIEECRIPEEKIHIVPLVERGDANARQYVQEEESMVLFFGRIWQYKGLDYLIRAEPLISAQVPDAKIVIAGRGEDFARYRRMMLNPERFVVHNEFVSYEKRAELFRRACLVVLPYVEATQSGVIPVAYTYAKPVVATAVGGLPEQVEHNRTGLLVPPADEQALADSVVRLLQDKELRHRLGANGKRKADTEWSAQAVARQTLHVYRCAIDHHCFR